MAQPPAFNAESEMTLHNNAIPAPPYEQPQQEQGRYHGWMRNDKNVLLVVTTLITTLTYQLGTNLPMGYYQDDNNGHHAGDSILKDKDPNRFQAFMFASRVGFLSSMFTTLALLTGVRPESRRVRWSFIVSYPSLVITFYTSQLNNRLYMDVWFWVVFVLITGAAIHSGLFED